MVNIGHLTFWAEIYTFQTFDVSRITTLLARKRPISMKSRLLRAARGTSNFQNWSHLTIVAAVTWLKYCRFGVKLYPINQSINFSELILFIQFCHTKMLINFNTSNDMTISHIWIVNHVTMWPCDKALPTFCVWHYKIHL